MLSHLNIDVKRAFVAWVLKKSEVTLNELTMKPAEIKALRKELRCTTHELAAVLGVDAKTVMAWEHDEMFPTKRFVAQMKELRAAGPAAVPRKRRGNKQGQTALDILGDPATWQIVRKLIAHPEFREQVEKLAESYDEP